MVQQSILSFFSAAKVKKPESESESSTADQKKKGSKGKSSLEEDSPIKAVPRGKARVIESDSEDEVQPSTSSSPGKSDEEKENKTKNTPDGKGKKETPGKGKKETPGKGKKETPGKGKKETPGKGIKETPGKGKKETPGKGKKETPGKGKKETPAKGKEATVGKEGKGNKATPDKGKKGKASSTKQVPIINEEMEVDDQEEENAVNGEAKETKDDNSTASPSVSSTCETPTEMSSKTSLGFSPETVPPLRKTARKQMKRKSDSIEDKQREVIKKLKMEDNEEKKLKMKDSEDKKLKTEDSEDKKLKTEYSEDKKLKTEDTEEETSKDETSASHKDEVQNAEKEDDEDEPMEVDKCEKEPEVKKEEKSATPSAKKPIHSFFAPRSPKKPVAKIENVSPKKSITDSEDETGSSPVKKQKQKPFKKNNVIESDSEEESGEEEESPESKSSKDEAKSPEKAKSSSQKSPKNAKSSTQKSPKNTKSSSRKSPKNAKRSSQKSKNAKSASQMSPKNAKSSPEKEESSNVEEKENTKSPKVDVKSPKVEKKPAVNPFAPKSAGSADPGSTYNPGQNKYDPIKDAFWNHGETVPYLALAKTFEHIEGISGRLKTIEILSNFLRSVIVLSPNDLLHCVYLCLNKVAPAFEGTELGVGDMILMRAIAQTSGRSVDRIKLEVEEKGDLGIVAENARSNQRLMFQPAKLTVRGVFDKLREIALMTGNAVQNKKTDKIKGMFVACRFSEARYLIRSLGGKLRIGLAEQSVLQAIAQACYLTPPGQDYPPEILNAGKGVAPDKLKAQIDNYGLILKTTYCEFPSYDRIIEVLVKEGLEELPKHCKLTPGVPLKPMLAHPTAGVSEVLKRFENAKFTCEFKYDGERAQIHMKEDGSIKIYSRNQEDNTTKYPDIISRFRNALGENVKSCVIDSEAVAWDQEKKQILPFQILSTRKRKDADEKEIKVQVCVFPFDLLYLNGEALVREPFEKRRALLKENFNEVEGEFIFAKSMDSTNTEDIEEFLEESIKGNCEGLMVKTLDVDATYEIAKRSRNWLKLKKDYLDGVGDTIDAAVIGAYWGKGKRKGAYGCFLLACYDPDNEEFQSLCKLGTGFSEEQLQQHTTFLKEHVIEKPKSYYRYDSSHEPDCWFEAVQVWEIKCADLSISPHHKAASGVVDPEKGISLRFPRFLRIREDKTPENATSSSQIADLYNSQAQIQNKNASSKEEDFY